MFDSFFDFFTTIKLSVQSEIAVLLLISSFLAVFLKKIKQPIVLAYLVTGILISFFGFLNLKNGGLFEIFSSMGIMFLLFLVGIEMDYDSIKKTGKLSLAIGLGQIFFTLLGGLAIAYFFFQFNFLYSLYLSTALTFSSTVIIIKLLSDKGSIASLHGRAVVGLLLVQDVVVIITLIVLNSIKIGNSFVLFSLLRTIFAGIALFVLIILLGRSFFPYLFRKIADSQELLFSITLAWLFSFAIIVKQFGFSIEIAGFLSGLALANSVEKTHIINKIKPLRDFFLLIFFVYLGSLMSVSNFSGIFFPVVIFSIFVLVGNPLIVIAIMGLMKYKKRTSFLTGVTIAQISEFSLIFATIGLSMGHISNEIFSIIVLVGIITITLSTYLIIYAEKIFPIFSSFLSYFERKSAYEEDGNFGVSKKVILIGANRTGRGIINHIDKEDLLVIDFDPVVTESLKKSKIERIFADLKDPHLFEELNLEKTKLVISTSPLLDDNLTLIKRIKKINKEIKVVVRAEEESDALFLYKNEADYVLLPHILSGKYLGELIEKDNNLISIEELKEKDIQFLKKRK